MDARRNFVPIRKRIAQSLILLLLAPLISIVTAPMAKASACTFPADSLWVPVKNTSGSVLTDPAADVAGSGNNTNVDIVGTVASGSSPAVSAIDWYSTGTSGCFFFRMRVAATAIKSGRIDNNLWILSLGTGSTVKAWMVVNGNNSDPNTVKIYDEMGRAHV